MIEVTIPASAAAIAEGDYCAGIKIYGFEFSCRFIAGEYRVNNVSGQRYINSRPQWQVKKNAAAARQWLVEQIAALGPDYMDRHNALYEREAV